MRARRRADRQRAGRSPLTTAVGRTSTRRARGAAVTSSIAILSSDPLAIHAVAGLAVTLTPRLLADQLRVVRIASVEGLPARGALYALLPDIGARPLEPELVDELRATAA